MAYATSPGANARDQRRSDLLDDFFVTQVQNAFPSAPMPPRSAPFVDKVYDQFTYVLKLVTTPRRRQGEQHRFGGLVSRCRKPGDQP